MPEPRAEITADLLRLRETYPALPATWDIRDKPPDESPHFGGLTDDRVAIIYLSPDATPSKNSRHEAFHAAHQNAGGDATTDEDDADDPVLVGYWEIMGYTTLLPDAIAQYQRTKAWGDRPSEHLAEAWAYIASDARAPTMGPHAGGIWARYGGDLNARKEKIDSYFRSLRPQPLRKPKMEQPTMPPWPSGVPRPTDTVEDRIVAFWDVIDQLPPDGLLGVSDLREWVTLLFERDPRARVLVRDFRAFTAQLQAALDEAK